MKIVLSLLLASISVSSSASVKVHKRTQYFVDIEANKKDVWISCTDHPENGTSYLGFHIYDGDKVYFFNYRRPRGLKQCHDEKAEYHKMMEGEEIARIVGISPDESAPNPKYLHIKGIPERFTNTKKEISSVFIRLQVKNRCKSYFPDDCELSKNYWGGVIPE
jgi:hypothetical protein